jgi:aminoglycoside 2'-N-acetyltransferase I
VNEPRDLELRRLPTAELTTDQVGQLRQLLSAAFGPGDERFTDDDWQHALGGLHFVLELDGAIVAHASVVERELHVDGKPVRTGYVEAVATDPAHQRAGFGSRVMRAVASHISRNYELGALGTGSHGFYERLGWQSWRGPTSVRIANGERRTPGEDGYIMVLTTPSSPPLDPAAPVSCEWRPGDVW